MSFQGDSIFWVEVDKIVANPFQPRREFDEDRLKELAESIRMYGVLQPLTVTRREIQRDDGAFYSQYELIAGERRWRASKLAGLEQVPVIIRSGEQTEQEKLELAIIENLQREDLNAVDRALAFKQLADAFSLSHAQVAKKVGRSREYVTNSIRLLALPEYMLNSLKLGDISEGHGRTLLMLKERPEEQDVVYREILLKKLSVREVERIARKIATDKVRKKDWAGTDAHLIEIEKAFTDTLGTRVQISKTDYGGKVTIDYFSEDDLQKILSMLRAEEQAAAEAEQGDEPGPVVHELDDSSAALATLAAATALTTADEAPVAEGSVVAHTNETAVEPSAPEAVANEPEAPVGVTTEETPAATPTNDFMNTDEFAFIREQAEKKDDLELISPYDDEDVEDAPSPAETPAEVATQPTASNEANAASVSEPDHTNAEAVTEEVPPRETAPDGADDGLYSLRNFSL